MNIGDRQTLFAAALLADVLAAVGCEVIHLHAFAEMLWAVAFLAVASMVVTMLRPLALWLLRLFYVLQAPPGRHRSRRRASRRPQDGPTQYIRREGVLGD